MTTNSNDYCIVCFSNLTKRNIMTCSNNACFDIFCMECLLLLLDYSIEEQILPKCPSRNCNSYIILCDLYAVPIKYKELYYKLCLDVFLKNNVDEINKELNDKNIISKLITERQKFINDTYPESIALVANIAFKSKLNKINKQHKILINKQLKHNYKKCMNLSCDGRLNEKFICIICETEFCTKCEKILESKHICKNEDVECLNLINNMIKCPGCQLPVFKNEGCNHITCSNCKTSFDYITGEKSNHGSVNTKINVIQSYKLSTVYNDSIPDSCREKLIIIENTKPKKLNQDIMIRPVKNYIETKDDRMGKKLAHKINDYYLNLFLIREYTCIINRIEKLLQTETINEKEILRLINKCNTLINKK